MGAGVLDSGCQCQTAVNASRVSRPPSLHHCLRLDTSKWLPVNQVWPEDA